MTLPVVSCYRNWVGRQLCEFAVAHKCVFWIFKIILEICDTFLLLMRVKVSKQLLLTACEYAVMHCLMSWGDCDPQKKNERYALPRTSKIK